MTKTVLVVDDSALMRRRIGDILRNAGFRVETASDGATALATIDTINPDVVTMDVTMPGMDGLDCLRRLMIAHPRPVVMLSSLTAEGAGITLEALRLGAVEAVQKPTGLVTIDRIAEELVETVRAASDARPRRAQNLRERLRLVRTSIAGADFAAVPARHAAALLNGRLDGDGVAGLVLIGVSTGGPRTLEEILPLLPARFPWPILIAQHMPPAFTGPLARRLNEICEIEVVEGAVPTDLVPGRAVMARGGADMVVANRAGRLIAQPVPPDANHSWHPSVERLAESALRLVPPARLIGVMLTGMGNDGAAIFTEMKRQGGRTIAESEDSAVVFGMPQDLIRRSGASQVLPADRVAEQLVRWVPATAPTLRGE